MRGELSEDNIIMTREVKIGSRKIMTNPEGNPGYPMNPEGEMAEEEGEMIGTMIAGIHRNIGTFILDRICIVL